MSPRYHPSVTAITNVALPNIKELGADLLKTSWLRRLSTLVAPFVAAAAYFAFASREMWALAVLSVVALTFVSYGSSSHDLVHRNIGLPKRFNDALLRAMEMLSLRSGTAYQLSHLHHHRTFPGAQDVEASMAGRGLVHALLQGPVHQFRLWLWAWRLHRNRRLALAIEAIWFVGVGAAGAVLARAGHYELIGFVGLVIGGSWTIPLITVHVPHDRTGQFPLAQTRAFRGWFYDLVAFGHLYHLEHHLYPMVPHHHWRTLARRLDPYFEAAGIKPLRVF